MLENDETFDMDDDQIECVLMDEYEEYWENKAWEERNCFFTEREAEEHLTLNHYHYSPDAHTYVKHFWRAPEVEKLFQAVGVVCGVEYANL